MKQSIEQLITHALHQLEQMGELSILPAFIEVTSNQDVKHGEYTSNIAFILAKVSNKSALELAEQIKAALPTAPYLRKVEVAAPGYLNFYLTNNVLNDVVNLILNQKHNYGRCKIGRGKRILIEFLSSNPIGPLHIGHGRHAAYGAALANILSAVGFKTYREYYVNDAGKPIDQLSVSVWLRYLSLCGEMLIYPSFAFQGNYILGIAKTIYLRHGKHFHTAIKDHFNFLFEKHNESLDKWNELIRISKYLLGDQYQAIYDLSLENVLADIKNDMADFNIHYDNWFSERQLITTGMVDQVIDLLKKNGATYCEADALFLRTTEWGDEKDRVLIQVNGKYTCFANDIAYHYGKFDRGFDIAVNVFGADQYAYFPRLQAGMRALGIDSERLIHLPLQWVSVYSHDEKMPLSNRKGSCLSLRKFRKMLGNDTARIFYLSYKNEHPIELDYDEIQTYYPNHLAHYIQYACARIVGVFEQLLQKGWEYNEEESIANLHLLNSPQEELLIHILTQYPDVIMNAALHYDTQLITVYLRRLASSFHTYYAESYFLVDDDKLRNVKLALILAVKQVLFNGCQLLGIHITNLS